MKARSPLRFVLEGIEGLIVLGATVVTWPVTSRWLRDWGSTPAERESGWPGDGLMPYAVQSITRAVTIRAPAEEVWARVVQFGLGRAGFYSYELLERLGGIPVTNIESVELAWQTLLVGDQILILPNEGLRVSMIAEGEFVCFGKRTSGGADVADGCWSIYVYPSGEGTCRLIVRACAGPLEEGSVWDRVGRGLESALDFVMEQRMLRTIRRLSEADQRARD